MCYLLIFHISLFVFAILCFVKGKLQISHNWVAVGAPAYFAGVVLLLPFPLTIVILVGLGAIIGAQGQFWNPNHFEQWSDTHGFAFILLTFGISTMCCSLAFLIGMIWARDPAEVAAEERLRMREMDDDWNRESL